MGEQTFVGLPWETYSQQSAYPQCAWSMTPTERHAPRARALSLLTDSAHTMDRGSNGRQPQRCKGLQIGGTMQKLRGSLEYHF
jgi:hypothetical protein